MKKKRPGTDIEATLDAVAADHLPGQTGRKPPIGSLVGTRPVAPMDGVKGKQGLLSALKGAADAKAARAGGKKASGGEPAGDAEGVADGYGPGESDPSRKRLREARQAAKLRAEKAALQAELKSLKAEKEALKSELHKATRLRDAAEKALAAESSRREAAAHDLFDAWRRSVGLEFESAAQRSAAEKARKGNADAVAMAERALDAQAAANRKYGTVRALREDFDRIDRLAGELRFAERDSLYPVPEIRKAIQALEARRRELLENPESAAFLAPTDPEVVRLSLRSLEEIPEGKGALPRIERFQAVVASLAAAGLVEPRESDRLHRMLEDKVRRVIRAEISRSAGRPGLREETFESLVRDGGASRYTLVVDGNNVLVTNESVFGDGGVIPDFTGKRNRLNQALARIAPAFRQLFAVYDGNEEREESREGRLVVVFTEKSRRIADDWIAARISDEKADSCILATDDAGLIARCPAVHAVIGARHLYEFLAAAGPAGR
jgi:hypothetical protein